MCFLLLERVELSGSPHYCNDRYWIDHILFPVNSRVSGLTGRPAAARNCYKIVKYVSRQVTGCFDLPLDTIHKHNQTPDILFYGSTHILHTVREYESSSHIRLQCIKHTHQWGGVTSGASAIIINTSEQQWNDNEATYSSIPSLCLRL